MGVGVVVATDVGVGVAVGVGVDVGVGVGFTVGVGVRAGVGVGVAVEVGVGVGAIVGVGEGVADGVGVRIGVGVGVVIGVEVAVGVGVGCWLGVGVGVPSWFSMPGGTFLQIGKIDLSFSSSPCFLSQPGAIKWPGGTKKHNCFGLPPLSPWSSFSLSIPSWSLSLPLSNVVDPEPVVIFAVEVVLTSDENTSGCSSRSSFNALRVSGPTLPTCGRPCFLWNFLTASLVRFPNWPVINPCG